MATNILSENKVSFNEIEKEIFRGVCREGQRLTKELLEYMDDELAKQRDRSVYRDKGKRDTSIKTVYGEVEYSRRVYQTKTEDGKNAYVFLLDETIGMDKIGLISTNLGEKIAATVVENPFRVTADIISDTCGQSISHSGAWDFVQKLGKKLEAEEDYAVKEMNSGKPRGEREVPVLFEEMDGLWIAMQGKGAKKAPGQEIKMATIYEGWDAESKNASRLVGKVVIAAMEDSESFLERREGKICQIYDAEKIGQRILNGDGGNWIHEPYDPDTIQQLDRFHVIKEIKRKIGHKEYQKELKALLNEEKVDELIEAVKVYADSVATDEEENIEEEKALELKEYLENHKDELKHYDNRGIEIPEPPEGIVYKYLGVQENQNATVAADRMKHGRKRWSQSGANHMVRLLCSHENGDLIEAIDRFTDGFVWEGILEEITGLSAAKAPKEDGKGNNPYIERFGCHLPILDTANAGTVRAMRGLIR